jgi:glycosyltransferase involved in cell wall biosynthesis
MTPRNIVYVGFTPTVANRAASGGMGVVGIDLLNGLDERGHRVRALTPISAKDPDTRTIGLRSGIEVTPYTVPGTIHRPSSRSHFEMHGSKIRDALPQVLAAHRADVVILSHVAYVDGLPEAVREHAVPWMVWMVWMHGAAWPVMMFGDGGAVDALAARMLQRLRQTDLVVPVAEHIAVGLRSGGVSAVATVANGIDPARFIQQPTKPTLRAAFGLAEDDVVVLHASNMRKVKRVVDLVHSAAQTTKRDPRLVYLLLGDGPLKNDAERACAAAGLADRFTVRGWVEHDDIADFMAIADIFVLPSEAEGQPLAILEAQAAGCAVIAADIPACRELISDGETGLLFPVGNIEALSERTLHLAAKRDYRRQLGINDRRFVEQHHHIGLMIDRFEGLIDSLARAASR